MGAASGVAPRCCKPPVGCCVNVCGQQECNFECAIEQVVVKRQPAPWHLSLGGWLGGSKPSICVELNAEAAGERVCRGRRTGPAALLSRGSRGPGGCRGQGEEVTEVWGWDDSESYGPRTCAPMDFSVPTCAQLHLQVMASEGGAFTRALMEALPEKAAAHAAPGSSPGAVAASSHQLLLGEARFRLDEDVLPLSEAFVPKPTPGAGAHLSLPLVLQGIDCGSVSLICRLQHEDPKLHAVACAKSLEVDFALAECGCGALDEPDDGSAIWSPRQAAGETMLLSRRPGMSPSEMMKTL